ncbi:MAG: mannose-1-phosphate guanylyltransferase [Ignavibacteriaceae bacterium]|nr:mannose-1-phosphate guanylyltransferase [Ignavibacterium sp.]MCC6254572.1 mannose-1-phosphate guanylyltransferase [Ignavibacteriaceae bacterium]HRN26569.1 mannose-1-phosphate guanylyltransferase [Ignavibacteriaceae bacterium]HRP94558.1 mannose-1-phosphate guanylyltransferase [Ignavibacteriaceae bacterium]HRQ54156.1 mannose-1-phosphate guanylyltransferase [Ignavibacteriaceae bacterium]
MKFYAVIMAGGVGSRFWPRSKKKLPKQLLQIFGDDTMIQATVNRLAGLIDKENIYVITNELQSPEVMNQLKDIPAENIIEEPFGRNTAACIGLASVIIKAKDPDAITVILPADHIIKDVEKFKLTLENAAKFANESKGLVTIGIEPTRPETGYGYIQINDKPVTENIFKVLTFAEKPNYATAVRFVDSGDFLWNSGMFIWRCDVILDEIKNLMPDLHEGLITVEKYLTSPNFKEELKKVYAQLKKISIDYGIMEKSTRVFLTKGSFNWSDVGSWEEVYQLSDKNENGNATVGNVYINMVNDSYVYSPDKVTAVIGLDNVIVINDNDNLLICRRDKAQDVKEVVEFLKMNKMDEHL